GRLRPGCAAANLRVLSLARRGVRVEHLRVAQLGRCVSARRPLRSRPDAGPDPECPRKRSTAPADTPVALGRIRPGAVSRASKLIDAMPEAIEIPTLAGTMDELAVGVSPSISSW